MDEELIGHRALLKCALPSTFMRRSNSLWSCPTCGKVWALRRGSQHGYPEWEELGAAR